MDPLRFLNTEDPVELIVMNAVSEQVAKLQRQDRKELAVEIANNVSRLFK